MCAEFLMPVTVGEEGPPQTNLIPSRPTFRGFRFCLRSLPAWASLFWVPIDKQQQATVQTAAKPSVDDEFPFRSTFLPIGRE
jgi:hypothetical protein